MAVNAGIKAAKTDYVILLNNDVLVEKGFCRALEKVLDENPKGCHQYPKFQVEISHP